MKPIFKLWTLIGLSISILFGFSLVSAGDVIENVACVVTTQDTIDLARMRTQYYVQRAESNNTSARETIQTIKSTIEQKCGTSIEIITVRTEEALSVCEQKEMKQHNIAMQYLKQGDTQAAQLVLGDIQSKTLQGIDCEEVTVQEGKNSEQAKEEIHQVQKIATSPAPVGNTICANTPIIRTFNDQIVTYTDPVRLQALIVDLGNRLMMAASGSAKGEMLLFSKSLAQAHLSYLQSSQGGLELVNTRAFCESVLNKYDGVFLIENGLESAIPMDQTDPTTWTKVVYLTPGTPYHYNFLINGQLVVEQDMTFNPDEEGEYTIRYSIQNPRYVQFNRIEDAIGDAIDAILLQRYLAAYTIFATSTDAQEVANTISSAYGNNIYNRISSAPGLPNAGWASTHTFYEFVSNASKLAMGQYIIDHRAAFMDTYEPMGGYSDGATEEEWYWIAQLATDAILERRADMLDAVNAVQLVGGLSDTNEWGEDNEPENLATALQDYIMNVSVNELRGLSSQEKSDVLQYMYDNRPYANREAIIEARAQGAIIVQNMKYINAYTIFATSTDAQEVANTISSAYGNNIYNRISSAPGLPNAGWASTHTFYEFVSNASKLAMGQYIIDHRAAFMDTYEPMGGYSDGATEEEWYWIAQLATDAILERRADMLDAVNAVQLVGGLSDTNEWGEDNEPENLATALQDYIMNVSVNELRGLSSQEKSDVLQYMYDNRPYANREAIIEARAQGAIIVQNMKYINAYTIFATSTDAQEVANTISSAYGNNIYNRISSAPGLPNAGGATHTTYEYVGSVDKQVMGQYIIDHREEFMEEYEPNGGYNDGATEEEWYWIAHVATNAIIDRTEQLFTMINQSTSAGSISQRGSSIWEEGVMIYPLSSYLLSYATNALSYGGYSLQERQFILDYVFANKPYSSLGEIQSASEQGSPQ